ncbi:YuzF family protein [Sporosarcina sp. resist]|uniref:YuzF family protein n=1 Tax=Sporosarcina sp. resist TaxID=2762563 RepID=UPI00164DB978|nr:YuzF family protein [Sporosarcina sp. resist]QNK86272.1 YuzF family protein [Sporosarcina sp. resist]
MNGQQSEVKMVSVFDPYFYQTLLSFKLKNVVIQTTRNPLQGSLLTVMPDHVVIEVSNTPFYVRIQEIIWVTLS